MTRWRVALVDDHPIFAAGLKKLLEAEGDFEVVALAHSFEEAVAKISPLEVDLVLLDFNIPGGNGLELLRKLREAKKKTAFLMLTVEEDEKIVIQAILEGARGYVLKQDSPERLLRSIRACLSGEVLLSDLVYSRIHHLVRKAAPQGRSTIWEKLSPREQEVVRLLAQGKSNREIGELLFISEKTVKNHVSNILQKLGLSDRREIIFLALREGFLEEAK
ncbi:response regulator [Candidatus Caldatribacterium saccharofermentans]|uniref:response regulator n=1 Tax=Candidatus Caldatribacterium saccharofermentans TaxID=1454753 RepID=UPI003CFF6142